MTEGFLPTNVWPDHFDDNARKRGAIRIWPGQRPRPVGWVRRVLSCPPPLPRKFAGLPSRSVDGCLRPDTDKMMRWGVIQRGDHLSGEMTFNFDDNKLTIKFESRADELQESWLRLQYENSCWVALGYGLRRYPPRPCPSEIQWREAEQLYA